jgi:His-Xaa-Ser system protein HxsD
MLDNYSIIDGCLLCKLDSNFFSKESISKCLYWYSDRFLIDIRLQDCNYVIKLQPKGNENLEILIQKINQDFIDYNLRQIVTNETTTIRELIIAKAFSNGEFDEDPPGELDDPIGFNYNF